MDLYKIFSDEVEKYNDCNYDMIRDEKFYEYTQAVNKINKLAITRLLSIVNLVSTNKRIGIKETEKILKELVSLDFSLTSIIDEIKTINNQETRKKLEIRLLYTLHRIHYLTEKILYMNRDRRKEK